MKFIITTTTKENSKLRMHDLEPILKSHGIKYELIVGEASKYPHSGLYETVKEIIKNNLKADYFIMCEDDVVLTKEFSVDNLNKFIVEAKRQSMDVLATGAWESGGEKITCTAGLLEVLLFRGTQLTVIFKSSYQILLNYPTYNHLEETISKCNPKLKIGLTMPFLSKQREDIMSMITVGGVNHNYMFHGNEERIRKKIKRYIDNMVSNSN